MLYAACFIKQRRQSLGCVWSEIEKKGSAEIIIALKVCVCNGLNVCTVS